MDGFSTVEASTSPAAELELSTSTGYFIISAHNGGGSSGEEPAP